MLSVGRTFYWREIDQGEVHIHTVSGIEVLIGREWEATVPDKSLWAFSLESSPARFCLFQNIAGLVGKVVDILLQKLLGGRHLIFDLAV